MIYKYLIILLNILYVSCYTNINIDATGLFIPYSIGALGYIKKNITFKNGYHLTGISGGSWASVIYNLEDDLTDHDKIWEKLISDDEKYNVRIDKNLEEFQNKIKLNILKKYDYIHEDYMKTIPISIIVSTINKMKIKNEKIDKFKSLEELLDFCICSSYIPFISGTNFMKKYKDTNYVDGGIFTDFSHFDCKNKCEKTIYVHRRMWGRKFDFKDHYYLDKKSSKRLFEYGWQDTEKNIDKIFNKK